MKFHKTGSIIFHSKQRTDLDYIRGVSETVYRCYQGSAHNWQLTDSEDMWKISFGGRAGVLGVKLDGRICCVKLFYDMQIRNKLRALLGFSKGRRAYHNGIRLMNIGINCPLMLGYAEQRPSGPVMIITELINDGLHLDQWVPQYGISRDAVILLARFIRNMHEKGVSHLDLSPRNILIRCKNGHFEYFLLDYEDARFTQVVSQQTRLDNVHHLHERMISYVPIRDRLLFLREYGRQDYPALRDALQQMIQMIEV